MSEPAGGLFRSKPLMMLIGLAVASIVATIALVAFGSSLFEPSGSEATTFSYSAIGHRGAYSFLQAIGVRVARNREMGLRGLDPSVVLVVAEPPTSDQRPDAVAALRQILVEAHRRRAPVIVILPKWHGSASPTEADWVGAVGLRSGRLVSEIARSIWTGKASTSPLHRIDKEFVTTAHAEWGAGYAVSLRSPQLLSESPAYEAIVTVPQGVLVARLRGDKGDPPLVLVADPDIMSNHGLIVADHAALFRDLIVRCVGADAAVFDETLHGYSLGGRLVADVLKPPAAFVTAHLLVLAGVVLWSWSGRTAPPKPSRPPGSIGREEFFASTARLLASSADGGSSLLAYWKLAQDGVADALGLPPLAPRDRLIQLAQSTARRGVREDLESLDARIAESARPGGNTRLRADLARRVHQWKREMTLGSRSAP